MWFGQAAGLEYPPRPACHPTLFQESLLAFLPAQEITPCSGEWGRKKANLPLHPRKFAPQSEMNWDGWAGRNLSEEARPRSSKGTVRAERGVKNKGP